MKHFAISTLLQLTIATSCMVFVSSASAQETKIGYVSTERVMRESAPAKAAEARLDAEFSQRRKDLHDFTLNIKAMAEKLDKDSTVIPESDRSNLLANGVTAIYTPKDFDIARIMRDIAEIAATYRKSQK